MEEKLQKLYNSLSSQYNMPEYDVWKSSLSDPEKLNKAYSYAKENFNNVGTIDQFKSDLFPEVKKKVSTKPSAFNWETGTVDVQKLSSTQPAAPTAGKSSDVVVKDGVEMNWGTGEVTPKSAFQKNAESVYQLVTTDSVKQAFQEETSQNEGVSKPVTFSEAAMAGVESFNKGFYEQAIGGTLKGAGELMLKGVKLLDKEARPEDIWLWQAGDALQKQFQEGGIAEPTSDPALLESDLGQISAGIGQMAAMILTGGTSAEGQAMAKIQQMTSVLKTASKQFFSRPAMMGTMQMIGDGSDQIREEKKVVDNMDRDTYVKINVEVGMDPKLAGKKYDKLKESSADDLISEMLPTWFMEGSTEGFVVGEWFKRFNKATGGSFGKVFMEKAKDVTVGTFEGAAQEALQQWMDNATAKEVYDYTLSTTEGMAQSAKVGGAVQFIFETISAALGVKNRNASADDKVFLDKAQEAIKQREQELARNLENTLTEEVKIEDVKAELDKKVQAGEMKQEEADAEIKDIEAKKEALQKIPEEHKTNPDVVDATTEKTKIDKETETLKEEIKTKDPAFTADEQAKIKENELKSAELSIKASEAAGLAPDPKAVKLIEAQKESVSEEGGAKKEGKVQEVPPVSEPKPLTPREAKKVANEKMEEFASQPDTDLSGISDQDVTRKILEEGSAAQVGQAWQTEPDVIQGEVFTKESAIEEAVTSSTFDSRALEGIPDVSGKYFPKEGEKAQVADLAELAEELSDQTGMNITEADIADYIRNNPEKKKPQKIRGNPNKRALAKRFKELTGINPNQAYVDKLVERSGFLKEKQAVEQEFPEAKDVRPAQPASQRMKKSLMNRVVEDPLIPLEIREKAKKGELEYDVLTDEHVNAVADFEISENMKSMDVKDGLEASVETAKSLMKEAVDTKDAGVRETNGAIATTILFKAAFNYAEQGMMAESLELYDYLDSYSRGIGRQISSLRGSASPEGVAGMVAVKAFESQVRELSKKGKNQTLEQMLKDLRKEIEKARSKANLQEAKVAAAKKTGAKIAASQKVEAAKKSVDEARAKLASVVRGKLSAGIDPEVLVALKDLFIAYKNLLGANLSLIKTAYMEAAAEMGLDADEAWNAVNDLVESTKAEEDQRMPELPTGEQMSISEGQGNIDKIVDEHYKNPDGRTLASKLTEAGMTEKDARNYEDVLAKELEKKERASVLKAIQNFKEKVRQEEIEGIKIHESKWNGSVDKLANAVFHGLLDDQNLAASVAGYFGFNALTAEDVQDIRDISSKIINGLQSNAVVNPQGQIIGYQPIGQAAPAGMTLQPVTGKSPELIARAQKEMKTKLLQIEKRNNGIMPLLAGELQTAMHMGALANTGTWYNVSVGTMWASLPSLIGLSIANPIAAVNAIKTITKSKTNEWSRGWGVFRDAFYSNFSTLNSHSIYFEGQYTSHASLLEAAMLHGMRKQAQKISKATGTDFLREMAIGIPRLLIQAYRIASAPMAIDGLLTHPVSEYVRYIEAWNKISEEHKLENLANSEIANIVAKYGQFTEHAWGLAKQQAAAEVAGMKASGKEIPLDFESRRAKEIIHQNVRRAELESAFAFVEKASLRGEMTGRLGVGYDWLMSAANREKVGENWHWSLKIPLLIKNAIFMFLRVAIQGANFIEKTVPVAPMLYNPFLASLSTGKEVARRARTASVNPNVVNRMAANKVLSKLIPPEKQAFISSMMSDLMSKYVGEDRMKEYPEDRQLGRGFVTKSATEKSVDIALQAMTTTLMVGLAASMFDRDDEDNLILDPDRWIDVSASLDNDPFTNESNDGMKKYSVRYRQSDGTWSSPSSFALWLPFVSGLSILGGIRDDIMYREEKRKDKDVVGNMGAASMDILGALGEMSFNGNAQSVGKIMKASKQAAAEDSPAPYGTAIADIAMRPFKAVIPGVYRDLFVNELGAMGVDPIANKPQGLVEQMMKDIPMLDNFIGNDRYDEYGNPIYRESKPLKILERMSFNYMDFVTMNEKTRKQPEWVLTSKFEGMSTPGQYYPARSLKVKKEVDGRIKGEKITEEDRTLMSEAVAKRKGLIVNKYYDQLNKLNKQELEQMLYKIHNFAGDIIKFEMGYSSDKRKPEFNFGDVKKSVKEKIKKEQ